MLRPVPKVPLCMSRPASAATYCEHQPGARHCGGGDRRERDVDRSERTTHLPFIQLAHIEKRRPYLHQPTGLTRIDLAHRVRLHACAGPRPGQTEEQVLRPRESVDGGIGCPHVWLVAASRRQDRTAGSAQLAQLGQRAAQALELHVGKTSAGDLGLHRAGRHLVADRLQGTAGC